jgi:lipopolysaccharide export system protein LptA
LALRRESARWDCAAAVVILALALLGVAGAQAVVASAANAGSSDASAVRAPIEASPPTGEITVQAAPATPAEEPSDAASGGPSPAATPAAMSTAPSAGNGAEGPTADSSDGSSAGNPGGEAKGSANSSPFSALASPSSGPIKIKSDSLSVDYKKNSALWRGHVHAVRADGELSSDTLQVIYGKDFHELQQMIASGSVRISRGTQWSVSDHAVLNEANQTVVLTGNPVVHDGNDQITGSKITVYLKTGESVVEGAKAVIFPRQTKTRDNGVSADHAR